MNSLLVSEVASKLVAQSGRNISDLCTAPCPQGGSNRLFRIECASGRYAAKSYFRDPGEQRDRLTTESGFVTFARKAGLDAVPDIIGADAHAGVAVYEWIEGARPRRSDIGERHVLAAARFFRMLNRHRHSVDLPAAYEASFSVAQALERIDARLPPLLALEPAHDLDRHALVLIHKIARRWSEVRTQVLAQCAAHRIDAGEEIHPEARAISPSDFGFHNALKTPRDELRFIDFEHAGFDDPAKMMADFFCQPALPVPLTYWQGFASEAFAELGDPAAIEMRARLLLPAFRLRWCCVALNLFGPVAFARRRMADPGFDELELKREQLAVANHLFAYCL